MGSFEIIVLGSSSATPAYNRNPSAQLLNINDKFYLIDCGEATQNQLNKFKLKSSRIDYIFISHLHGDHYLGLVGLLSTMHLNGRVKEIHVFGPPQLKEIVDLQLMVSETKLRYEVIFHFTHTEYTEQIFENNDVTVETIVLNHRIPTTGFLIKEKPRKRKINTVKLEEYDVPLEYIPLLKNGIDYSDKHGKTISNAELTFDPSPPRSFAYCSDTLYNEDFIEQIEGVNFLYHEATFLHELLDRAIETFHTTALQAGIIAKKANVKQLMIGHFSARYRELDALLIEAKTEFENTVLAIEGEKYLIC
jgi:ribonuclease Z